MIDCCNFTDLSHFTGVESYSDCHENEPHIIIVGVPSVSHRFK
jgi:hypothetical protein